MITKLKLLYFFTTFFLITWSSTPIKANNDSISFKKLFEKNQISWINVIDSTTIQYLLTDTTIDGWDYFESAYSKQNIEKIERYQVDIYGKVKIKPQYISSFGFGYIISWVIPITLLLIVWTPGILAIFYFRKLQIRIELKWILIIALLFIPVLGLVIYPLRKKIKNYAQ